MAKRKNSLEQKMEMFLANDELGRENLRLKARIRDLEAELAEALEKTDKLVLEAQRGEKLAVEKLVDLRRELAEARLDGARLDYVLSHTEGDFVIGDVSAEGFWDDMEAEHIGDDREHLRAWRRAIDSALEVK